MNDCLFVALPPCFSVFFFVLSFVHAAFLLIHLLSSPSSHHLCASYCHRYLLKVSGNSPSQSISTTSSPSMDTHDVSEEPQYLKYLVQHKKTLQNAQRFKGQQPKQKQSREDLIMEFMFRQMASNNMTPDIHEFAIRSSFLPPTYVPSIAPFRELSKIMIKDLVLETHHRGSYLLLRTVTPADRMTAVLAIVEDEEGKVLVLQLYNQNPSRAAEDILNEGAVLIIKEPYLKVMADGGYGIRVDHLSDVKFVPGHDRLVPPSWRKGPGKRDTLRMSAQDWRMVGNDFFNKSRYH